MNLGNEDIKEIHENIKQSNKDQNAVQTKKEKKKHKGKHKKGNKLEQLNLIAQFLTVHKRQDLGLEMEEEFKNKKNSLKKDAKIAPVQIKLWNSTEKYADLGMKISYYVNI